MSLIDKDIVMDAIQDMTGENGYVIADNFARSVRKIINAKEFDIAKEKEDEIKKFRNELLDCLMYCHDYPSTDFKNAIYTLVSDACVDAARKLKKKK